MTSTQLTSASAELLPPAEPVRLVDADGTRVPHAEFEPPGAETLAALYRRMVIGRRFDAQATTLTRQGVLAVYPSSRGQEACEVAAVMALSETDWLFPTYRDTIALITRDIDAVEATTLLRGDWHCGYDPRARRTAPQCSPLATHACHAVGLTEAAKRRGEHIAALAFLGDGSTSEGDAHEAFNLAAVFGSAVVFFVQNNQWAISVPLRKQTKAPTLAHKAIGYGIQGYRVDGNDAAAVHAVTTRALAAAHAGRGPALIEAVTYRMEPHTNADDPSRYRGDDTGRSELARWSERDPIERLRTLLRSEGVLDDAAVRTIDDEAEQFAADTRERVTAARPPEPAELFAHVYAEPTVALREQRAALEEELAAERAAGDPMESS